MQILKISPLLSYNRQIKNTTKPEAGESTTTNPNFPTYNHVSFEARVDKGLVRFYEANADRMPHTVKKYIETLPDKTITTPLQAQAEAFAVLAVATTVGAVKSLFPEEELFQNLTDINETKATRGILGVYRQNKELLEMCDKDILANKENFTVWLVKKVFLEGKTMEELNKDLNVEMDPDFRSLYESKEKDGTPIRPSTLKALGVELPKFEYMQSLRYTRDGYSDLMGEKISQGLKEFMDSLSPEQRTERAKKSVLRFVNWWESIPRDEKLEMIANQIDELELLSQFNEFREERAQKYRHNTTSPIKKVSTEPKEKVETGLSQDDLFKIWAKNNLKLYEANLTEMDKKEIQAKRTQKRAEAWEAMSPEEQIEYISKLKSGSEQLRFAMIDAWNNNQDILVKLSLYLKRQGIEKPVEILYGSVEFNKYLSQVMKDFWVLNPNFALQLGNSIKEANSKIKDAVRNGDFNKLRYDIMQARAEREKAVATRVKAYKEVFSTEEYNKYPDYMKDFIDIYSETSHEYIKHLPSEYLKDFFNHSYKELSEDIVKSWTRALNNEVLTTQDQANLEKIKEVEPENIALMNRALEAAIADVLYDCTQSPLVYTMSQTDCKIALSQIDKGYPRINLISKKTDIEFDLPIKNRNIDEQKIEKLYKHYKTPLNRPDDVVFNYFVGNGEANGPMLFDLLEKYVKTYGKSAELVFSPSSTLSIPAKLAFLTKFNSNMPYEIANSSIKCLLDSKEAFLREDKINEINNKLRYKYNFITPQALGAYLFELNQMLRSSEMEKLELFEKAVCTPRKTPQEHGKIASIRRDLMTDKGNLFTFLCIEQAIADSLYKATGEEKVYSLTFEELIDNLEVFMLVKKYPSPTRYIRPTNLKEEIELKLLRKPNLYKLNERIHEYANEMRSYVAECARENKPLQKEELMYILNPEENKEGIDNATMARINSVFNDIQKIAFADRINY